MGPVKEALRGIGAVVLTVMVVCFIISLAFVVGLPLLAAWFVVAGAIGLGVKFVTWLRTE